MGITLATIFTMLRLASEAKMRQVICSGACPPVPGGLSCSGPGRGKAGWGEGRGLLSKRYVLHFPPDICSISCFVWPLIGSPGWVAETCGCHLEDHGMGVEAIIVTL